jgi:hypothetical protein
LPKPMVRKALGIDFFGWIGMSHAIDALSRCCFEVALCPLVGYVAGRVRGARA